MENKGYKGNGLAFYKALRNSGKSSEDVRLAMNVSNGTFYRMLKKEVWTDYEKELAGKALDLDWQIMFGLKPSAPNKAENSNKQNDENQKFGTNLGVSLETLNKPADKPLMENNPYLAIIEKLVNTNAKLADEIIKIKASPQSNLNFARSKKAEGATVKNK